MSKIYTPVSNVLSAESPNNSLSAGAWLWSSSILLPIILEYKYSTYITNAAILLLRKMILILDGRDSIHFEFRKLTQELSWNLGCSWCTMNWTEQFSELKVHTSGPSCLAQLRLREAAWLAVVAALNHYSCVCFLSLLCRWNLQSGLPCWLVSMQNLVRCIHFQ